MRWLLETAVVRVEHQLNQTATPAAAASPTTPPPGSIAAQSAASPPTSDSFDANMVIILAALLCALILALGLNSILRCVLRCSTTPPAQSPYGTKARRGGLKKGALRRLPVAVYGDGAVAGTDCPICLGDFEEGDQVRALPGCGHGFHARCVDAWLVSNSSCPTCRRSLLAPERDGGEKGRVAPEASEPRMGYRVRAFFVPPVVISPAMV